MPLEQIEAPNQALRQTGQRYLRSTRCASRGRDGGHLDVRRGPPSGTSPCSRAARAHLDPMPTRHMQGRRAGYPVGMPQQQWSKKRERSTSTSRRASRNGAGTRTWPEIAARTVTKRAGLQRRAEQRSRTSTDDISSSRRGDSGRRGAGGRTRDQLYEEAKRQNIKGRLDDQGPARGSHCGSLRASPPGSGGSHPYGWCGGLDRAATIERQVRNHPRPDGREEVGMEDRRETTRLLFEQARGPSTANGARSSAASSRST